MPNDSMPQDVDFASGSFSNGPFLILYVIFLNRKKGHINSGLELLKLLKTWHINVQRCFW